MFTVGGICLQQQRAKSIGMAPFEALYGRKCRAPTCWNEVDEKLLEGPDLVQVTTDTVEVA